MKQIKTIIKLFLCHILLLSVLFGCAAREPRDEAPSPGTDKITELPEKKYLPEKEFSDSSGPDLRPIIRQEVKPEEIYSEESREYSEPIREVPVYTEDVGEPVPHSMHTAQKMENSPRSKAGDVVLNFDNADLYEVIRSLAELLNINYIADPNIRGNVSIHTAGHLDKSDLFPVFFQILEANGLTAIKEGSLYKIIPLEDASRMPIVSRFGEEPLPGERIIIQIIPLRFISVQEVTKLLTPFISAKGAIVSHENSNTLLLVDKAGNIAKALKLVRAFDMNVFEKVNHRIYRLEHTDAEEMGKSLDAIMDAYGPAVKEDVKFIPVQRLNALIVISSFSHVFDRVQDVIRQIDIPGHDIEPRIYVYSVRNGAALELAELLNSIFAKDSSSYKEQKITSRKEEASGKNKNPATPTIFPPGMAPEKKTKKKTASAGFSETDNSGTLRGTIRITPDEIRNALIIEAIPRDYHLIEDILRRLDVLPRQVLINVKIIEISLDKKTDLGINWWIQKEKGTSAGNGRMGLSLGGALFGASNSYAGLQYIVGEARRWEAAISALNTEKKIKMLSEPSILASDNKEAKINISTEVPVASAQYQYDSDSTPLLQTNIQYRNTGIILAVTPHINEFGLVSMDISQEVSNQLEDNVQVGNDSLPAFFKRSVKTSLTVRDGQTIVIGGLIRETKNRGYAGVPCLGDFPLLQYMFGTKSDSADRTELIILITPRVIISLEDVDAVTNEFKNRVGEVMKTRESFSDSPEKKRKF